VDAGIAVSSARHVPRPQAHLRRQLLDPVYISLVFPHTLDRSNILELLALLQSLRIVPPGFQRLENLLVSGIAHGCGISPLVSLYGSKYNIMQRDTSTMGSLCVALVAQSLAVTTMCW
jgi:hypothetical protein